LHQWTRRNVTSNFTGNIMIFGLLIMTSAGNIMIFGLLSRDGAEQ
jgi:hypothetical protein